MVNQCRVVEYLSQAMPPGFVRELALVECPISMDLVWMIMTRCCRVAYFSFLFSVVSVLRLGAIALIWGGVMIWSPCLCIGGVCVGY